MDRENFMTRFTVEHSGLLDVIRQGLLTGAEEKKTVEAELYKLNVYGEGAFFKPHLDTPRSTSMFASLVVVFPTPHEGGELVLRHGGKEWTSGVWAEPELIDATYWEFSEAINKFLITAEKILPPYRFGVYDVLVLPPSFPYGGMENACLTFLTPTLLVGDRTLVDVVVHELTHSWFGNGVTYVSACIPYVPPSADNISPTSHRQANSTHFWLNEGWTTYIERVLLQLLHTPADRGFSFLIGRTSLTNALKQYTSRPKYQRLVIDFDVGEDPDDAYSTVPYEKGANFLLHLERMLGGLDAFLPDTCA
ncbi:hypothetical protein NUW54_g14331 [Trametes sanguinea]|uniref:Uncharacterized protein n=1 Tax=Trametes sanguinea TaxID=158606 RepID=A0ACC1MCV5_9APHY|nr:hypothetical protein NUW54_g14331 [Trametes sanguinea]